MSAPARYLLVPASKFDLISLDFFGGLALPTYKGYSCILSCVEMVTGFVQFYLMKNKQVTTIRNTLREKWFAVFGAPKEVHSDNEPCLIAQGLKDFYAVHGVTSTTSSIYRPSKNGQVERVYIAL